MRNDNERLPGRNANESFAKLVLVLGLVGLGMSAGQHIAPISERDDLTDYGKKVAWHCDEIFGRYTRFHFGDLERPGTDVVEALRYEFELDSISVEVVDFGEQNLDGKGFWHRVIAVSFDKERGMGPDYLVQRVTV